MVVFVWCLCGWCVCVWWCFCACGDVFCAGVVVFCVQVFCGGTSEVTKGSIGDVKNLRFERPTRMK